MYPGGRGFRREYADGGRCHLLAWSAWHSRSRRRFRHGLNDGMLAEIVHPGLSTIAYPLVDLG